MSLGLTLMIILVLTSISAQYFQRLAAADILQTDIHDDRIGTAIPHHMNADISTFRSR
jgi:hypothetical protein